MDKRSSFTRALAIAGTSLAWLPLLIPLLFSALTLVRAGIFHLDYLLPAELFPVALLGGGLLVWAERRIRVQPSLIAGSLGLAIAIWIGGQLVAVLTGLASGAAELVGWRLVVMAIALVVYLLALFGIAIGGILLLRSLFRPIPAQAVG